MDIRLQAQKSQQCIHSVSFTYDLPHMWHNTYMASFSVYYLNFLVTH